MKEALVGVGVGVILGYWIKQKYYQCFFNLLFTSKTDTSTILRNIRPNILRLKPYRCARDDYSEGILLDANENSFGPPLSPKSKSLYQKEALERYPCPYQLELKSKIAQFRNVDPNQIFLGVGSDEAIDLLIRISCKPGKDAILITPPTYGMYSVCANINDVQVLEVPLTDAFQIEPQKIIDRAVGSNTKLIFLCNPGNPTAKLLRFCDVETILASKFDGFVVIDEAYIDFADEKSYCRLLKQYEQLVVLQTLSKGFGLAGIRLGMAFGHPELIQILNNVKAPYNINKLTSKVATNAFNHLEQFHATISMVKQEKERMASALLQIPSIKRVLPSDSNFLVFELPNAYDIYKEMATDGIVIRYRGNLIHLKDCLRATIGRPEENDQLLSRLQSVAAKYNP